MRRAVAIGVGGLVLLWVAYFHSPAPGGEASTGQAHREPLTAASAAAPQPAVRHASPESTAPQHAVQGQQAPAVAPPAAQPMTLDERAALFRRVFDSEPRDALWANDQEPKLAELLAADEFTSEDLESVACRSTVCRVTFAGPALSSDRTIAAQARLLGHFSAAHFVLQDAQSGRPQLYLLRQDYELEARERE